MQIITFGSCLSRYTANHFVKLFGGTIISSVFHNRSDAFVGKFVDKNWIITPEPEIAKLLKIDKNVNIDDISSRLLHNQYAQWMGLHRLGKGIPLFKALNKKLGDLIIIDNYIDISARLMSKEKDDRAAIFLRQLDFKDDVTPWLLGDYLSTDLAVESMHKIINYFRKNLPNAVIVFLNFPYNTYESKPDRVKRSKDFENAFKLENDLVIPALTVHPNFQTRESSHYKPQQYAAYAGIVYQHLNSLNRIPPAN